MRLHKLFEDKDPMVVKYEQQLRIIAAETGKDQETILLNAMDADPTKNYEYVAWILKQMRFDNIRLPEDVKRVRESIAEFHRIKRIKTAEIERDIFKYDRMGDLEAAVEKVMGIKSKRQTTKSLKLEGAEVSCQSRNYIVIKMLTAEAAVTYAKGTKWCTSDLRLADNYMQLNKGLFIVFRRRGKGLEKKIQFTGDFTQFKDLKDVTTKMDGELYGLLRLHFPKASARMIAYLERYTLRDALDDEDTLRYLARRPNDIITIARETKKRVEALEYKLLEDLDMAFNYWLTLDMFEWPEFERRVKTIPVKRKLKMVQDVSIGVAGYMYMGDISSYAKIFKTIGLSWNDICRAAKDGQGTAVDLFFDNLSRSAGKSARDGGTDSRAYFSTGSLESDNLMNDSVVLACIGHHRRINEWNPYYPQGSDWGTMDEDELAELIVSYIIKTRRGRRWPAAEAKMISERNVKVILKYLTNVVKGSWPEVEGIVGHLPSYRFYRPGVGKRR